MHVAARVAGRAFAWLHRRGAGSLIAQAPVAVRIAHLLVAATLFTSCATDDEAPTPDAGEGTPGGDLGLGDVSAADMKAEKFLRDELTGIQRGSREDRHNWRHTIAI